MRQYFIKALLFFHYFRVEDLPIFLITVMPLAILSGNIDTSIRIRAVLLGISATLLLVHPRLRQNLYRNVASLPRLVQGCLVGLMSLMILSTATSRELWQISVFGLPTEYLGLCTWLGFIIVAVGVRDRFSHFLSSREFLAITGLIVLLSLIWHFGVILDGDRPIGLLLLSTSNGVYGAFIVVLAMWHMLFSTHKEKLQFLFQALIIIISMITVVSSQSRLAHVALFAASAVFCLYLYMHRRKKAAIVMPAIALSCLFLSLIWPVGSERFYGKDLDYGVGYRLDIYKAASQDAFREDRLQGIGPSALPAYLNDEDTTPPSIAETLSKGYIFISSHNILLDMSIFFGIVGAISFVCFSSYAVVGTIKEQLTPRRLLVFSSFLIFFVNAMLNVPSVEMTSLLFVSMFALIRFNPKNESSKT